MGPELAASPQDLSIMAEMLYKNADIGPGQMALRNTCIEQVNALYHVKMA
jgi:hypothetical protein